MEEKNGEVEAPEHKLDIGNSHNDDGKDKDNSSNSTNSSKGLQHPPPSLDLTNMNHGALGLHLRRTEQRQRKHDQLELIEPEAGGEDLLKQNRVSLSRSKTVKSAVQGKPTHSTAMIHHREVGNQQTADSGLPQTSNPLLSELTSVEADALYVVKQWGTKKHSELHEKTSQQKRVDAANVRFRENEYMSTRWKIRDICDNPSGRVVLVGVLNKAVNYTLIGTILGSVLFFVMDSFNVESNTGEYCNLTLNPNKVTDVGAGQLTCSSQLFEQCDDVCFRYFEGAFTVIFLIEFVVRLIVSESYCRRQKWTGYYDDDGHQQFEVKPDTPFFLDIMNYCDFVAIAPFFMELALQDSVEIVGVLKLLRVLRVFKIARHFSGSKVMFYTVKMSARGLLVALFFLCTFLFFASVLLQVVDPCIGSTDCTFVDPINGAYYIVITMSSVGYGDQVPLWFLSRAIAVLFMFFGTFYIAMPLAVVGNKFEAAYKKVYGSTENAATVSAHERRQIILNQSYKLCTCIDVGRNAHDGLQSAITQRRPMAQQLSLRRTLHRTMKKMASTHAAICTHIDILTPSTVLLKKRRQGDHLSLHATGARDQIKLIKSKSSSSGELRIMSIVAIAKQATTAKHLRKFQSSVAAKPATVAPEAAAGQPQSANSTHVSGTKTDRGGQPQQQQQQEEDEEGPDEEQAQVKHLHPEDTTNTPHAFVGTIRNISCSKRYFNIEYDSVDRETIGMEKTEHDVLFSRLRRIDTSKPVPKSWTHHKAESASNPDGHRTLRVGDKVLVFAEDHDHHGIAYEMEQERQQMQFLVRHAKKRMKARKCKDALWLFLVQPDEFKKTKSCGHRFAKIYSFLRVAIVALSVVGVVVQTDSAFNFYGPHEYACQMEALVWCNNVESAASTPDFAGIRNENWPCYPQRCSNFSETEDLRRPGHMLLCNEDAVDVEYPGLLNDPGSFPFFHKDLRLNVTCGGTTVNTEETSEERIVDGNVVETVLSVQVTTGEEPFVMSKVTERLMNRVMFGTVPICQRRQCVESSKTHAFEEVETSNLNDEGEDLMSSTSSGSKSVDEAHEEFRRGVSNGQLATNQFFGGLEVFFCTWYLLEYILNLIAIRPIHVTDKVGMKRWYKDAAIWIELVSMFVCVAELGLVSLDAQSVAYTVWGFPLLTKFSTSFMRPLRIVVMIRLCVMMRGIDSMRILTRTVKETYERLMVPIFFLLVFGLIFAGLFYTTETLLTCVATVECSDGTTDLYECPGQDDFLQEGVGTVVYFRHEADINFGPAAGDLCMLQNMWDAVWLSFVSISTVGYGVLYPVTSLGKGVAMVAAAFGTIYLAMPLSIVGARFYAISEEYETFTSLRRAKKKFQKAMGAVLTINMSKGRLAQATRLAARTGDNHQLKKEIFDWERQGKSKLSVTYLKAIKTAAALDEESEVRHEQMRASGVIVSSPTAKRNTQTAQSLGISGGLFYPKQLQFLLQYCEYEAPLAEEVTSESFDNFFALHQKFMSILAEQFLFHDEWDVSSAGPLKRREHDLRVF